MIYRIAMVSMLLLAGCTSGLQHLLAGLAIEDVLDHEAIDAEDGRTGPAGLSCWDLDGDGLFSEDEDIDGDREATAYDCRGADGNDGLDGLDGEPGAAGPQGVPGDRGLPGATGQEGPPGVVQPSVDDDDGPPFGRGPNDHPPGPGPPGKPGKP